MSTQAQRAAVQAVVDAAAAAKLERGYDPGFHDFARSVIVAYEAAAPASEWRPTAEAPQTPGVWIEVRCTEIFSWRPYKNGHVQDGARGRWRKLNEYGGFDNAELPDSEWRPHRNPTLAKESGQ